MSLKMWKKDTKTGTRLTEFDIEEKTSGGAVFERGVKQSKEHSQKYKNLNDVLLY